MDKNYRELFQQIAQSNAIYAEQVMENDKKDGKENSKAETMRDRYQELFYNLKDEKYFLTRNDYISLFLGGTIIYNNLVSKENALKRVMGGYKEILPKLESAIKEPLSDEQVDRLFSTKD